MAIESQCLLFQRTILSNIYLWLEEVLDYQTDFCSLRRKASSRMIEIMIKVFNISNSMGGFLLSLHEK